MKEVNLRSPSVTTERKMDYWGRRIQDDDKDGDMLEF